MGDEYTPSGKRILMLGTSLANALKEEFKKGLTKKIN